MKTKFFFKAIVLLCTMTTLFACSNLDDLELIDEIVEKQEALFQVDKEVFVSSDKATEISDLFFSKLVASDASTRASLKAQMGNASVKTLSEDGIPLMYIINYPNGGWSIVGATKNYYPILAYSDKDSFEIKQEMSGVSDWLEETKGALKTSDTLNDSIKSVMQGIWDSYGTTDIDSLQKAQDIQSLSSSTVIVPDASVRRLEELMWQYGNQGWSFYPLSHAKQVFENAGYLHIYENLCYSANFNNSPLNCSIVAFKLRNETRQVGPLLATKWHQGTPFNNMIPNGRSAGCGAIAVAQVMRYYLYPQSFTLNGYTFNWNNIPVFPQSNSDQDALVRLVGLFIDTHYNSYGSWATPGDMEDGIRSLGYSVSRGDHDYGATESQLINYQKPVIMGGNANNVPLPGSLAYIGNSHYWVCDGAKQRVENELNFYTEWQPNGTGDFIPGWYSMRTPGVEGGVWYLHFHMNWGWGGTNDGWFGFNNVDSGNGNFKYARQDFYITKP